MVLLKSEKIPLGFSAPSFNLPSVDGRNYSLTDFFDSSILVVLFICNHCPYVQAIETRFIQLGRDFLQKGVQFVGICSNDSTDYPADSPANLLKNWREKKYPFPYLIDSSQEVAKAYGAVCTPDIFVFDSERKLAYHGQLDDNWQDASKVKKSNLREALSLLLKNEKPSEVQAPSMGCSIKWRRFDGA